MSDFIIGLTGGVASGKSEVTRRFEALGVAVVDADLAARAVVVIDENDQVVYSQLVNEITEEPDYDAALAALKA